MNFSFISVSLLLIILISQLTFAQTKKDKAGEKPNIILIMVDDMGYSDLGSFG